MRTSTPARRRAAPWFAVPPPFQAIDDVVAGLAALEGALANARDLRGLFVMTYRASTATIQRWIDRRTFLDNQLMARLVVTFGNLYRSAVAEYAAGERSRVPVAWQQSFDACITGRGTALQCLMLSVNAHVNRDLPYAILDAGVDVDCTHGYSDYVRIDGVTPLSVALARRNIARVYWRDIPLSQRLFGRGMEALVVRSVERARRTAWTLAQRLARAETDAARAQIGQMIEHRAALVGEAILAHKVPAGCIAALVTDQL
jgi:uncharacterized protein DUF5995